MLQAKLLDILTVKHANVWCKGPIINALAKHIISIIMLIVLFNKPAVFTRDPKLPIAVTYLHLYSIWQVLQFESQMTDERLLIWIFPACYFL